GMTVEADGPGAGTEAGITATAAGRTEEDPATAISAIMGAADGAIIVTGAAVLTPSGGTAEEAGGQGHGSTEGPAETGGRPWTAAMTAAPGRHSVQGGPKRLPSPRIAAPSPKTRLPHPRTWKSGSTA